MGTSTYLIALGSNMRTRHGSPRATVTAAAEAIGATVLPRIHDTVPLGPGKRTYANAVAAIETERDPIALLAHLKTIESAFGRRASRRWGDRPLDLDIIGWSEGTWVSSGLTIPHPAFRARRFVLAPLAEIAPAWRDPLTGLTVRQLRARLDRKRPRP